ncbi:unnamed protein product, partial [Vitis vinifera]|uniref:Uncharacterized protein n=1 Tax=Vitis vinifera TaxID=29760 RepID=D7SWY3_VITVI
MSSFLSVRGSTSKKPPHASPILFRIDGTHNEIGKPTILTQASFLFSPSGAHPNFGLHTSKPIWIPPTSLSPEANTFSASSAFSNSNRAQPFPNLAKPSLPLKPHTLAAAHPKHARSSSRAELGLHLPIRHCLNLLTLFFVSSSFISTLNLVVSLSSKPLTTSAYSLPDSLTPWSLSFSSSQHPSLRRASFTATLLPSSFFPVPQTLRQPF